MTQHKKDESDAAGKPADRSRTSAATIGAEDPARNNQENEVEAEQESAAAMDADVPQPPDASTTTEGQPS